MDQPNSFSQFRAKGTVGVTRYSPGSVVMRRHRSEQIAAFSNYKELFKGCVQLEMGWGISDSTAPPSPPPGSPVPVFFSSCCFFLRLQSKLFLKADVTFQLLKKQIKNSWKYVHNLHSSLHLHYVDLGRSPEWADIFLRER